MKRKDKIIIRTEWGMYVLCCIYTMFFFIMSIIALCKLPHTKETFCVSILAIIATVWTAIVASVYFRKKETLYLEQINEGVLIIKDKKGRLFDLKISQIKYKIFDEDHVLLQDSNYTVLLEKSKKLIRTLNELGALTKELK